MYWCSIPIVFLLSRFSISLGDLDTCIPVSQGQILNSFNFIHRFFFMSEGVSGWLLFNATSAIFQLYHSDNKLIFNEMMLRSALYTLGWIFIVLAHWNNSPQIDMSPHSDTLSRFRANQSLFFLLTAAYLAKKQQIPIL
jgi:hypothetical protein